MYSSLELWSLGVHRIPGKCVRLSPPRVRHSTSLSNFQLHVVRSSCQQKFERSECRRAGMASCRARLPKRSEPGILGLVYAVAMCAQHERLAAKCSERKGSKLQTQWSLSLESCLNLTLSHSLQKGLTSAAQILARVDSGPEMKKALLKPALILSKR